MRKRTPLQARQYPDLMKVTMTASSLLGRYWLKGHIFPVTNILDQSIKGSICFSWIKARFLFSQLLIFQGTGIEEAQNAILKPWILSLALPKIVWMTLGTSWRADIDCFDAYIFDSQQTPPPQAWWMLSKYSTSHQMKLTLVFLLVWSLRQRTAFPRSPTQMTD